MRDRGIEQVTSDYFKINMALEQEAMGRSWWFSLVSEGTTRGPKERDYLLCAGQSFPPFSHLLLKYNENE